MASTHQARHLLQRLASASTCGAACGENALTQRAWLQLECSEAPIGLETALSNTPASSALASPGTAAISRPQQQLLTVQSGWDRQSTSSRGAHLGPHGMHPTKPPANSRISVAGFLVRNMTSLANPYSNSLPLLRPRPNTPAAVAAATALQRSLSTSRAPCDAPNSPSPSPSSQSSLEQQQQQSLGSGTSSPAAPKAAAPAVPADPIYNLPNAVSAARLVSGPVIAVWLLQGQYEVATVALAISGASDWLDGYLARRMNATSVFGSYLDPLADKVLIACVASALLANGSMPLWLGCVVVGRDALLVAGSFAFRLGSFGWKWPGREAFFRTADTASPHASAPVSPPAASSAGAGEATGSAGSGGGCVSYMRPLLISKANTVLQLVLMGGYLTRGMYGWPEGDPVTALEVATATTTVASLVAYGRMAAQGELFK
ncbi:hypothetical protein Agub_g13780 [Astrephomene gubernaculifera]|uniref:Cardiolipin synthase n=1 Tax=Astrephomene gubernaculifera TaxID=47775 RepID=A0AAD3E2L6_9CHLO|nr:hypothetical protein Agub_g13780 [Astrephomene gubernaculifera]